MSAFALKAKTGEEENLRKLEWNHINTPDWLDVFIQRLQYLCELRLKENPNYLELMEREQKLLQKYPIITQLFDGEETGKEMTISVEVQNALVELFSIKLSRNTYEELEIYLISQGDFLVYLNTVLR